MNEVEWIVAICRRGRKVRLLAFSQRFAILKIVGEIASSRCSAELRQTIWLSGEWVGDFEKKKSVIKPKKVHATDQWRKKFTERAEKKLVAWRNKKKICLRSSREKNFAVRERIQNIRSAIESPTQRGRKVSAPNLKSGGRGFKSCSEH